VGWSARRAGENPILKAKLLARLSAREQKCLKCSRSSTKPKILSTNLRLSGENYAAASDVLGGPFLTPGTSRFSISETD
jgi:hypothetical protein